MPDDIRLLLLEDVDSDAELIVRELRRAGLSLDATRVARREEFERELGVDGWDVILADYNLPGYDGMAALAAARTRAQDTPFIFVSGSIGEERAVRALTEGATDYVLKDRLSRLPSAILRSIAERDEKRRRRKAEDQLRLAAQRFYYVTKGTNDGVWDWDVRANSVWLSDTARTLTDAHDGPDEIDFGRWLEHVYIADRDRVRTALVDLLSSRREQWFTEYRCQARNGQMRTVLDRGYVIYDDAERPLRVVGTMQDVTARVRASKVQSTRLAVNVALSDAPNGDALQRVIAALVSGFDAEYGSIWLAGEEGRLSVAASSGPMLEGSTELAWLDEVASSGVSVFERVGSHDALAFPITGEKGMLGVVAVVAAAGTLPIESFDAADSTGADIAHYLERRRDEERLRASEAKLNEAQQIARIGSWEVDVASGRVEWAPILYDIMGVEHRRFVGHIEEALGVIHPEDVRTARQLLDVHEPLESGEIRILRKDGEQRTLFVRTRPVRDRDGRVARIVGIAQDITEQKNASARIEKLTRLNDLILHSAGDGILTLDLHGRATFVNPAGAAMLSYREEEMIAKDSLHELLHGPPEAGHCEVRSCPLRQTLSAAKGRAAMEDVFWTRHDMPVLVEYTYAPMIDDGRLVGGVLTIKDVTTRKALERRLEQANRVSQLGRAAATLAHEFNNVLMGIQPFGELLVRLAADERGKRSAEQILSLVRRGRTVTQEILRFGHPTEPVVQVIDLNSWLAHLYPELQGVGQGRAEIEIETAESAEVLAVADPLLMQQVVTNLVANARDAMPRGGTIFLTASMNLPDAARLLSDAGADPAQFVGLSVRDQGSGIPENMIHDIFEPLFTTKRTGTGLGLAVVQQIILRHSGHIFVESEPGHGSTFYVFLPRPRR